VDAIGEVVEIAVTRRKDTVETVIVVGTSTGGPKALSEFFGSLESFENVAICIVQHMPAGFTANLAKRLNDLSDWTVVEGSDGECLKAKCVYIAPGGMHMRLDPKLTGVHLSVKKEQPVGGHQPSVDVLFQSADKLPVSVRVIGILLTGMGRDGAEGLLGLRLRGRYTIAESEETAVIYGMPKAAVERGAAAEVAPLWKIPALLKSHLGR
jgi:two-component system, chemotaxis family, protein-glutamate methylesterase/glutaminase